MRRRDGSTARGMGSCCIAIGLMLAIGSAAQADERATDSKPADPVVADGAAAPPPAGGPASAPVVAEGAPAAPLPVAAGPEGKAADPAAAAGAEPSVAATPSPIEISGFVDTYYSYNFNRSGADTQLRNFDTKHNQLSLNLIEVALEQKPTTGSRLGFRADLNFGPVTDMVHAFEPGGADVFKAFEQAYVSVLAPMGKGLQIDVGKFVTPHGAEVIEAKDNWNYSRSLLFALAIPYYHVGLRAALPVSDKVTFSAFAVNGWNNGVDNNSGKTFGLSAAIKPASRLSIVQNVMTGAEQADDNGDRRFLSDTTVTFNVTPALSLMANYDYGRDTVGGATVKWQGIASYARVQVNDWWAVSPRFEWFQDGDGFATGAAQTVKEITLTSEQKIGGALLTRVEYRRDFSDVPFFASRTGLAKSQTTVTVGLVYAFSSKL
jgi:hypothetical protein